MICRVCGALMGDPNRHLAWHIETATIEPDLWGDCPLDGAPIATASSGPDGGSNHWACGHSYSWRAEHAQARQATRGGGKA